MQKKVIDYADEKSAILKIVNAFNKELNDFEVNVKYSLQLEDGNGKNEVKKGTDFKVEKSSTIELTLATLTDSSGKYLLHDDSKLERMITSPGKYILNVKAEFSNSSSRFSLNYFLPFTAKSKVKLNHLKIAVTNSEGNLDDKEATIEYPKRSFKNIKATQNSVIKLKVKMNYGDNKFFKIEQVFLRLKHVEYGRSYSAYISKYQAADDYYYIDFDLSDPVTILIK
jgi:hypothetical protein